MTVDCQFVSNVSVINNIVINNYYWIQKEWSSRGTMFIPSQINLFPTNISQFDIFFPCSSAIHQKQEGVTMRECLSAHMCLGLSWKEIVCVDKCTYKYLRLCKHSICMSIWVCVTAYKKVMARIYISVCAYGVPVSVCMNNSRRAMPSAEASAPDRGWNIHANLVGRGPMRDRRRPGEREKKSVKNRRRSRFQGRLHGCNYPTCPSNFDLQKGNVSGTKSTEWCATDLQT